MIQFTNSMMENGIAGVKPTHLDFMYIVTNLLSSAKRLFLLLTLVLNQIIVPSFLSCNLCSVYLL